MSELINYQFKDRVIRLLFGTSKENALSLYNAVNRSEYDNPDDLEFNTIADAIYMGMKNDFSSCSARKSTLTLCPLAKRLFKVCQMAGQRSLGKYILRIESGSRH